MPDRRLFVRPYRGFAACIPRFRSLYTVVSIPVYRGFFTPPRRPSRKAGIGMNFQPPKACRTVPQWRRKSAISHLSGHFRIKRKPPPPSPHIKPRKPLYKIAKTLICFRPYPHMFSRNPLMDFQQTAQSAMSLCLLIILLHGSDHK